MTELYVVNNLEREQHIIQTSELVQKLHSIL